MNKIVLILVFASGIFRFPEKGVCQSSEKLTTVAEFGAHMAIGLSVNSQNRVFVSFPNSDGDGNLSLAEIKDGELLPYPDVEWNKKGGYTGHFLRLQDLFVDGDDNLWILDSKPPSASNIFKEGSKSAAGMFKLVKINTHTDRVEKIYFFDDLDKSESALNDVRIDIRHNLGYLSDPGMAAIVILDLETGRTRTVLNKTEFTLADEIVLKYDEKEMRNKDGVPFSSNVNGIALTQDFKYLYFKPINKKELFRIETKYLANAFLSENDLKSKVENLGEAGITHGLIADSKGNIFLTSSEEYSIKYITPNGEIHTLVKDKHLIWPDSMGIGTDGFLYFTCAQIQRLPSWNDGVDKTEYPYRAYKVKLP